MPPGVIRAPLVDVSVFGGGPLGCSAFPAFSLAGTIALIQRGTCNFSTKAQNAWDAGAAGVILYMADSSPLLSPGGLSSIGIPVVMISLADGQSLAGLTPRCTPGALVDINPHGMEIEAMDPNLVVGFSSIGPTPDASLKPDLVAVGGNQNNGGSIYMATQKFDPLGDMYSADGYAIADGTSFSTPLVSGAAALVKQKHPGFTAAQVKSALVNTASSDGDARRLRRLRGCALAGRRHARRRCGCCGQRNRRSRDHLLRFDQGRPRRCRSPRQFTIKNSGAASVSLSLAVTPAGPAAQHR